LPCDLINAKQRERRLLPPTDHDDVVATGFGFRENSPGNAPILPDTRFYGHVEGSQGGY